MHDSHPSHPRYGFMHQTMIGRWQHVWTILTSSGMMVEHFLQEVYPHEDRKHLLVGLDTEWYRVIGRSKMTLM